ncbi:MAG: hypothetical protein Q8N68_00675 [bacterium]|nr:hypothetical protein [bacterium]
MDDKKIVSDEDFFDLSQPVVFKREWGKMRFLLLLVGGDVYLIRGGNFERHSEIVEKMEQNFKSVRALGGGKIIIFDYRKEITFGDASGDFGSPRENWEIVYRLLKVKYPDYVIEK